MAKNLSKFQNLSQTNEPENRKWLFVYKQKNKTDCDKFPPNNKNLSFSEDAFEDAAEPEEKDKIPEAAGAHMIMKTIPQYRSVTKCCYNHNQYRF